MESDGNCTRQISGKAATSLILFLFIATILLDQLPLSAASVQQNKLLLFGLLYKVLDSFTVFVYYQVIKIMLKINQLEKSSTKKRTPKPRNAITSFVKFATLYENMIVIKYFQFSIFLFFFSLFDFFTPLLFFHLNLILGLSK